MFAAFIYRKKMVLKKKRIAATQLLYEDSLLKLKKLQAELLQLQEEQDNKMSLMIREKEEAIGKLKEEVKDIRAKFSNPLLSDASELDLWNAGFFQAITENLTANMPRKQERTR